MNAEDPLAALHPLRAPEPIGWWPPAPGWWVLLLLLIAILALGAWWLRRRYRRNAYRRRALQQLAALTQAHQANGDTLRYVGDINTLLKSAALAAFGHTALAAMHGEQWRAFINRSLPASLALPPAFDDAAYRASGPEIDPERLHDAARHWIRKHRVSA